MKKNLKLSVGERITYNLKGTRRFEIGIRHNTELPYSLMLYFASRFSLPNFFYEDK